VFTYEATLGFFALIPPGLRCCLGRRTALVRARDSANNQHYIFHHFVAPPFQEFLRSRVRSGSTVDRILLKDFPDYPILVPPPELVEQFERFGSSIWSMIHSNLNECHSLKELRDALLPKLISGEIRVREAEQIAEPVSA
jgi:type I restriction enzyme S subunit